jgi:chemotaxis protein histidine kinase CheA
MDTKELLNKIAKIKNAIESESDPDVKKAFQNRVAALEKQVAEAEVKVEKVEAKAAAEEKKELNEAEQKIQKLKAALASESDPDVKERFQKRIKQLEDSLKDVKQEIKEEKKEIAEQKKDIKQATKEVKSAQKEVRKTAIKKVAAKQVERKQVVTRKAKRKTKIKSIISDLDRLINKNKELKSKYKDKGVDLKKDAGRSAKPFGYRFVGKHDYRVPTEAQVRKGLKRGTIDYEARPNRSDVYPKADAKLADGGMMAKGGETGVELMGGQSNSQLKPSGYKLISKKGREIIVSDDGGKTKERYVKNDGFSGYRLVYNGHDYEFTDSLADGGMMAKGGRTKAEITADKRYKALKAGKRVSEDGNVYYESRANRSDVSRRDKLADGGMMKRGGKVGFSKEDKARYAKPAGWRWKDEAVTKRVIERKQLSMQPSKKMRDKYPDLVYFEDRLNKADKKPTRSSADSI